MTKRDFFILIIKVFGLFSAVTSLFSFLPSNFALAIMGIDILSVLWIVAAIIVTVGLFVVLVFKADKVVQLLKLDKGFDDDRIEIGNLKPINIIKLGVFLIGGLLILNSIPTFLSHLLLAFKADITGFEYSTQDKVNWGVSGLNLIIGFLLLTNYNFVAKRFETEQTENE